MRFLPTSRWWGATLALLMALSFGALPLEAEAKPRTPAKTVVKKKAKAKPVAKSRKSTRRVVAKKKVRTVAKRPAVPPLQLVNGEPVIKASVAYVIDQESGRVLFDKNEDAVRPIASLTKLMTGVVIADAKLPLDERITIADADVDRLKNSRSRLKVGTTLTRGQALHLTLMSSENRAAHALARTYPGGTRAFVEAMNNKARQLGMEDTHYVDSSGLSSENRSTAPDLALLAGAAYERPLLRKYSTSPGYRLGSLRYVNSNKLVREGEWPIGLQKTGYINEAGQCLLMQTNVKGRNLIMVFLDSASKVTRIRDAEIVRRWLGTRPELTATATGGGAS